MREPQGELYDIGYQHYEGAREGRMRARKAVWTNGLRTALGLGRPFLAKLFPWAFFTAVLLLAVIFTIILSLVEDFADVPSAEDYYEILSYFLIFFSALVAPELLCPDRRDGVINLYLVRPLTPTDYVASRWFVFFTITLVALYVGQTVLFIGGTLAADDTLDHLRNNWLDVPRFLGAGVVYALFWPTIAMAVAAFTTRRAYAAAFVVGLFIVSSVAAAALTDCGEEHHEVQQAFGESPPVFCDPLTGDAAKWFNLVGIIQAPIHLSDLIFDKESEGLGLRLMGELPGAVPVAWYVILMALPAFALWWRYQRLSL